jgi:uroporphyrinogen-III synthase
MSAPLQGMGIVLTRPRAAAEALSATLQRAGARVLVFPALAIEEIAATPDLESALAALASFDLAIFVSANAVEKGLAAARRRGAWPTKVALAAIGEATAEALRNSGFARVISPAERHDSDGLLALPQLRDVAGRAIIVFRGAGGRERLKEVLEERGARVTYAECYRRVRPAGDPAEVLAALGKGEIDAVSALSAETLENFVAMIGNPGADLLRKTALIVPHAAIAAHREARRFARAEVSGHGAEAVVDALSRLRVTP